MGLGTVALLHVLVLYALMTGLAKKVVDVVRAPIDTKVIEEVHKPPPVVELPLQPPPHLETPPQVYVPPPEVQIAAPVVPPTPPMTATTSAPPAVTDIKPMQASAQPAPHTPMVVSIAVACPRMVAPRMPAKASSEGINGSVSARATVRAGKVVNVEILKSQPRGMFDAAVRTAMSLYECQSTGDLEVQAVQDFTFKND